MATDAHQASTTDVHEFQLMLYTGLLVAAELGAMVLAVGALGVW